jgi:uncharacterized protein YaiI (UPF0178 family)
MTGIRVLVDADGCPVKREVYRVADRYELAVRVVSNTPMAVPTGDRVELVLVEGGTDAADDWIAEHAGEHDIVVTADIPLAARCLRRGARALDPRGRVFHEDSIGESLARRDLSAHLREIGLTTRGPAPFEKKDRSRFLQRLDELVQRLRRGK